MTARPRRVLLALPDDGGHGEDEEDEEEAQGPAADVHWREQGPGLQGHRG